MQSSDTKYVVLEITRSGKICVTRTTKHRAMMNAVRAAVKRKHIYKVVRHTTV